MSVVICSILYAAYNIPEYNDSKIQVVKTGESMSSIRSIPKPLTKIFIDAKFALWKNNKITLSISQLCRNRNCPLNLLSSLVLNQTNPIKIINT